MRHTLTAPEYERLADAELAAAAIAPDAATRRMHLDQASVYATLSEVLRRDADTALPDTESRARAGSASPLGET